MQCRLKKIRKIWIAISTPFQVNFYYSLIEKLKSVYNFLITARDHDRIIPLLEAKKLDYIKVGKHGGKSLAGKLRAYVKTVREFIPIIRREKPDLLLTERWPEAVRTASGFGIPAWTLFYDEREYYVNRMVFPLSSKVFAPTFYTPQELQQNGVLDIKNVVWFNGFHSCYLKDYNPIPDKNPFKKMGLDSPIVLVRTEPEFATYFNERSNIVEKTVKILTRKNDANIAVIPRSKEQVKRYSKYPVTIFNDAFLEPPVAYTNVTLGAAETMLMESFVLGIPTISALYWMPSKPVAELHKYIPHLTQPSKIAEKVESYLNEGAKEKFGKWSRKVTGKMENPVDLIVEEIRKSF